MSTVDKALHFQAQLLQQEPIPQAYQEYRMRLEAQLAQAERHLQITQKVSIVAILLAAGMFPLVASGWLGNADPWSRDANFLSVTLAVLYIIMAIVAAISTAAFYSRFSPRVRQVREELRDQMLHGMRTELTELRSQIDQLKQSAAQ